jgi:hypothetical protein
LYQRLPFIASGMPPLECAGLRLKCGSAEAIRRSPVPLLARGIQRKMNLSGSGGDMIMNAGKQK